MSILSDEKIPTSCRSAGNKVALFSFFPCFPGCCCPRSFDFYGKDFLLFLYMLQSYNLGSLSSTRGVFMGWGGFLNIFQAGRISASGWWKTNWGGWWWGSAGQSFSHQVLQSASKFPSKRTDSKISVVFIPTTMGSVAWLHSAQKSRFKNLQCPKKSHLSTKPLWNCFFGENIKWWIIKMAKLFGISHKTVGREIFW